MKNLSRDLQSTENSAIYKCDKCLDREYVIHTREDGTQYATACECKAIREHERRLARSGIGDEFRARKLNNYKANTEGQKAMKSKCVEYLTSEAYKDTSMCILGAVGSGKTHLAMAISNRLLDLGIGVVYVDYRSFISEIKQSMLDKDFYQGEIRKLIEADVLYIDDLYKGKITDTDINIMFEILNPRYLSHKPCIITSELYAEEILEIDEGTFSRVIERANGYILESREDNYRLIR